MAEEEEVPEDIYYVQRALSLQQRWRGCEPTDLSPLCTASVPLSVSFSAVSNPSEPSSTPLISRMHSDPKTGSPTAQQTPPSDTAAAAAAAAAATATAAAAAAAEGAPMQQQNEAAAAEEAKTPKRERRRDTPLQDIHSAEFAYAPSSSSSSSSSSSRKGWVDPLLNPDGITVRRPPKSGIRSGDPLAVHILKTKTFNFSKP